MRKWFTAICLGLWMLTSVLGCGGTLPAPDRQATAVSQSRVQKTGINDGAAKKAALSSQQPLSDSRAPNNPGAVGEKDKSAGLSQSVDTFHLVVTRDFGAETLFNQRLEISGGDSLMEIMDAELNLDTRFGGSFVSSINGLGNTSGAQGGGPKDWFFYINGICSAKGANDYQVRSGDVIWWDYHGWSYGPGIPAVIGSFPEPFRHGFNGRRGATTIMYIDNGQAGAEKLAMALRNSGVSSVEVKKASEEALKSRSGPVIMVGTWPELKTINYLNTLNDSYRKTGMFVHFQPAGLGLLDVQGKAARVWEGSAGVITATAGGLGDGNPLWLVTGTDQGGLEQALSILINNPQKIQFCNAAAVLSGEVIPLPLR